jgi:hypothetical protein
MCTGTYFNSFDSGHLNVKKYINKNLGEKGSESSDSK